MDQFLSSILPICIERGRYLNIPEEYYLRLLKRVRAKMTLIASETDFKLLTYSEKLGQCILKYVVIKV